MFKTARKFKVMILAGLLSAGILGSQARVSADLLGGTIIGPVGPVGAICGAAETFKQGIKDLLNDWTNTLYPRYKRVKQKCNLAFAKAINLTGLGNDTDGKPLAGKLTDAEKGQVQQIYVNAGLREVCYWRIGAPLNVNGINNANSKAGKMVWLVVHEIENKTVALEDLVDNAVSLGDFCQQSMTFLTELTQLQAWFNELKSLMDDLDKITADLDKADAAAAAKAKELIAARNAGIAAPATATIAQLPTGDVPADVETTIAQNLTAIVQRMGN